MQKKQLCPCGKDITDRKWAYHKYMCPKKIKQAQTESPATETPAGVTSATNDAEECSDYKHSKVTKQSQPNIKVKDLDTAGESPGSEQRSVNTKTDTRSQSAKTLPQTSSPTITKASHPGKAFASSGIQPEAEASTLKPSTRRRSTDCDKKNLLSVSSDHQDVANARTTKVAQSPSPLRSIYVKDCARKELPGNPLSKDSSDSSKSTSSAIDILDTEQYGIMVKKQELCPCGKDVNDRKYAYHKYRCPKKMTQTDTEQSERLNNESPVSDSHSINNSSDQAMHETNPNHFRPRSSTKTVKGTSTLDKSSVTGGPPMKSKMSLRSVDPCSSPAISETHSYLSGRRTSPETEQSPSKSKSKTQMPSMCFEEQRATSVSPAHHKYIDYVSEEKDPALVSSPSDLPQAAGGPTSTAIMKTKALGPQRSTHVSGRSCSGRESHLEEIPEVPRASGSAGTLSRPATENYRGPKIRPCGNEEPNTSRVKSEMEGNPDVPLSRVSSDASSRPVTRSSSRIVLDTRELDEFVDRMVRENVIQYSLSPDLDVKNFFDAQVKMTRNDISSVQKHFKVLREKIVGRLNVETDLGGWEYRSCGSHSDGTKVAQPDEMDCILFPRLSTKIQAVFDDCQPGFCKVKVVGNSEDQDIKEFCDEACGDQFLNSKKFRVYVFKKLEYIIEKDRRLDDIRKFANTLSFAIKYTGIPTESGMKIFDMDFVPSVHIRPWPGRHIAKDILTVLEDKAMAQKIKSTGFNATPKQCTAGPKQTRDLQWQISFSYAEKKLTLHADKQCWKPVTRTVKRIVEIAIGNSDFCARSESLKLEQIKMAAHYTRQNSGISFSPRFTTYHIRTLMWTLRYELTAGEHVWKEDTKAIRLRFTLGKLRKMLTGEMVVPHFFLPEVKDIMCGVTSEERKFLYIVSRATEIIFSKKP